MNVFTVRKNILILVFIIPYTPTFVKITIFFIFFRFMEITLNIEIINIIKKP